MNLKLFPKQPKTKLLKAIALSSKQSKWLKTYIANLFEKKFFNTKTKISKNNIAQDFIRLFNLKYRQEETNKLKQYIKNLISNEYKKIRIIKQSLENIEIETGLEYTIIEYLLKKYKIRPTELSKKNIDLLSSFLSDYKDVIILYNTEKNTDAKKVIEFLENKF